MSVWGDIFLCMSESPDPGPEQRGSPSCPSEKHGAPKVGPHCACHLVRYVASELGCSCICPGGGVYPPNTSRPAWCHPGPLGSVPAGLRVSALSEARDMASLAVARHPCWTCVPCVPFPWNGQRSQQEWPGHVCGPLQVAPGEVPLMFRTHGHTQKGQNLG